MLNHLTREELDGASLVVPGRTRRHVITEVGYQARALTRLTEWTASGVATPMFADPAQRLEEIADGATLPDRALRGLFHHAAVHLDVEWRDLTASQWDAMVAGPDGEAICVRETAWLRARCLWLRAVDSTMAAPSWISRPRWSTGSSPKARRNGPGPRAVGMLSRSCR